jgi:hypothetical protein
LLKKTITSFLKIAPHLLPLIETAENVVAATKNNKLNSKKENYFEHQSLTKGWCRGYWILSSMRLWHRLCESTLACSFIGFWR